MKTKILLTIIATIFLVGLLIAGGVTLIERQSTIPTADKVLLNSAGINDVIVENLRCFDTYCMFWINGNGIQTEQRVEKYKEVCIIDEKDEKEIGTCSIVLKSEEELIAERDKIVDNLIKNGFFIQQGEDEKKFNELKSQVGKFNISNIVMIVDNRCNFKCKYCQIEENMNAEQSGHSLLCTLPDEKQLFEIQKENPNIDYSVTCFEAKETELKLPLERAVLLQLEAGLVE